jgi:hypothetical protein
MADSNRETGPKAHRGAQQHTEVRGVDDARRAAPMDELDIPFRRCRGCRESLKNEPEIDLVILGSGELVRSLVWRRLISEFVLSNHPWYQNRVVACTQTASPPRPGACRQRADRHRSDHRHVRAKRSGMPTKSDGFEWSRSAVSTRLNVPTIRSNRALRSAS